MSPRSMQPKILRKCIPEFGPRGSLSLCKETVPNLSTEIGETNQHLRGNASIQINNHRNRKGELIVNKVSVNGSREGKDFWLENLKQVNEIRRNKLIYAEMAECPPKV